MTISSFEGCRLRVMPTCIAALAFVACSLIHVSATSAQSSPTVRDSIEWTYIVPFSWMELTGRATDVALWSPDRSHFVVHTRRADLETDANLDTLLLYETRVVAAFVARRGSGATPHPVTLVTVSSRQDGEAFAGIKWMSNSEIGFIARAQDGSTQASTVNITTRSVRQLSSHPTDVLAFSQSGMNTLYFACAPQVRERPLVARVQMFSDALPPPGKGPQSQCDVFQRLELFSVRPDGTPERLPLQVMLLSPPYRHIWPDPSGSYAVILAPAVNAPAHWADYNVPDPIRWGFGPQWVRSDPTSIDLTNRYRYLLVDLRRKLVRPLLDGPSGAITFNLTPPAAFWSEDGQSVIVSNTYLPLEAVGSGEKDRRASQPAIAEVNVATGAIGVVAWESVPRDVHERAEFTIIDFDWSAGRNVLSVTKRRSADGKVLQYDYSRTPQGWKLAGSRPAANSENRLAIELHESLSERPQIRAVNRGQHKVLFDPNPQAEQLALATAQVLTWKDDNGLEWTGGLLLPRDYVAGKRYPLIVQTHGFNPSKFLLDGPTDGAGGTAYAAQVFAGAGFVVLQIEDERQAVTVDAREGKLFAEGFYSGIQRLIARRLVDPENVGLIAFSRTGLHTLHLLARYPKLLAAASMSDSLQIGYMSYSYGTGITQAEVEYSKLMGGAPDVARIADWFERNPLYAAVQSRAAIRLEEMGGGLGSWETYTLLRRSGRPVEFVVYPEGSHVLQKPAERLSSQGGNVDWFRFWLQGYEDPDPAKRDQYLRWREMRARTDNETPGSP